MSFWTGTNVELLYASTAAGAAKNTFTTEVAINDVATMGPRPLLPKGFFLAGRADSVGKAIYVRASGIVSSTATPTYTFTLRGGATGATTGAILLGSAALTTASGIANVPWYYEGYCVLEVLADGAASTLRGVGDICADGYSAATTTRTFPLWGNAASPGTVTTFDATIDNYINFNVACSASSASNTITLHQLLVFGLN